MPNYVSTNFRVTGPTEDVLKFIEDARDGEKIITLNKLIPLPKELIEVSCPVRIMTQTEIDKQWAEWNKRKSEGTLSTWESDRPTCLGLTKENSDLYKSKYGTDNWYEWSVNNWGSKWDLCDVGPEWISTEEGDIMSIKTFYTTAWSPVTDAWVTVSERYPTLEFFHEFADEGGGFVGNELIQDGSVIESNEYEWDDDEGIVIREGVGMCVDEEEEV